jgi:predicted NAD/FAD-binding protein
MCKKPLQIAVIGSGISGILSAYLLSKSHEVTLFEKNSYAGGHTNTVLIEEGPDAGTPVDTGFIVLNDRTYPTFHRFLAEIEVPVRSADMSFGFYDETTGLQYAGTGFSGLFAQRKNFLNLRFIRMLQELRRFNASALSDLRSGKIGDENFFDYLKRHGYSEYLRDNYLVPMGAAIWSSPDQGILDFPTRTFLEFFSNHGLLTLLDRPQWQTVVGGSHAYVHRFRKIFPGRVRIKQKVERVKRVEMPTGGEATPRNGVLVQTVDGGEERFDRVVLAVHADQVLSLLDSPSSEERELFAVWRYQLNRTVLHTDKRVLPPLKSAWASWNYTREASADGTTPVSVSYHMNRLQGFDTEKQYCVTLNRRGELDEKSIVREIEYYHPVLSVEAVSSAPRIRQISGKDRIHYAGSYFGFGFHEDGACSAAAVAEEFGVTWG